MNIRSLIVALPLVAFSHSLVAMAAVPGNVRSVFPARGTETGPMGGARVSALAGGAVRVDAGLKERWTGLVVKFDGAQDFTSYQRLQSVISNCLDHPVNLCMSVWSAKGHRDQNETLPPNGVYRITVPMVPGGTLLDKAVDLVGMKGVPQPAETDSFDVSRVTAVNIVLGGAPTRQESFTLLSMTARGEVAKVSAEGFFPFVDRYGQFKHKDWSGKVHSDDDLAAARVAEDAWLAEHGRDFDPENSEWDKWGGWAKGPRLKATGRFRTEKVKGKWWLVDPDGRLFYSHGVAHFTDGQITPVQKRENYFEELPPLQGEPLSHAYFNCGWAPGNPLYSNGEWHRCFDFGKANSIRKYGFDKWFNEYLTRTHRRLRAWGLNSMGNWCDRRLIGRSPTPYCATVQTRGEPLRGRGDWAANTVDPFSKKFYVSVTNGLAALGRTTDAYPPQRSILGDPHCIGVFVDNERMWGWGDTALATAALQSPSNQPAKIAFRTWLDRKYGTPAAVDAAWGVHHGSWDGFLAATDALPSTKVGKADLVEFNEVIARRYFKTVADAVRRADPGLLYLGCRFNVRVETVYRAAAAFCDVVSLNVYRYAPYEDLPEGSADKPIIIGEFHFGALDTGMFHYSLLPADDQAERAKLYREYHEATLRNPRYVGAHWFQWWDQVLTARCDGENFQCGFLSITDTPYRELVEAARDIARRMYGLRYGRVKRPKVDPCF